MSHILKAASFMIGMRTFTPDPDIESLYIIDEHTVMFNQTLVDRVTITDISNNVALVHLNLYDGSSVDKSFEFSRMGVRDRGEISM